MSRPYTDAAQGALLDILRALLDTALPIALLLGLAAAGLLIWRSLQRDKFDESLPAIGRIVRSAAAGAGVLILLSVGWSMLREMREQAIASQEWRRSAEATSNPVPDAPPVYQFHPSAAVRVEKTYTRRLTIPPYFLERIGVEGVQVLSPYLSDPSADNVLRIADSFRRSGTDVVFTRELTRMDEEPVGFDSAKVDAEFRPAGGTAFEVVLDARYTFSNPGDEAAQMRFVLPLPQLGGTVRDLSLEVDGSSVAEPDDEGNFVWEGEVPARTGKTARVRYRALGGDRWTYDIGSSRRRVKKMEVAAQVSGDVRFPRGTIEPTSRGKNRIQWDLADVVTAQRLSLVFPANVAVEESYGQALGAMPAALASLLAGLVLAGALSRRPYGSGRLAAAVALFGLGLFSSSVLAGYLPASWAVALGSTLGVGLCVGLLGRRTAWGAVPAAAVPLAFLSAEHTGLILLAAALATGWAYARLGSFSRKD